MSKVFTGRFITVIVVSILSVYFVWPTFNYFVFVSKEHEVETPQERETRLAMLEAGGMIKLGLDLQGGVELLFTIDKELMLQREVERIADSILGEFKTNNVDGVVRVNAPDRQIVVSDVASQDVKIAQDIVGDFRNDLSWGNLEELAAGRPVVLTFREDRVNEIVRDAVDAARKTIIRRVDEYGLTQPLVAKQGVDRIIVQIPGETNPKRVRENLLRTANLEFRLLHESHDQQIVPFIEPDSWNPNIGTGKVREEFLKEVPAEGVEGATKKVVDKEKVLALLPAGYELFLGRHTDTSQSGVMTVTEGLGYLLRDRPELTGKNLRRAADFFDPAELRDQHKVTLEFDGVGTEKFADVTRTNVGRQFAIVLDDVVQSAPVIRTPILYGRCEISGGFSQEEARDLALVLKSGSLPAPLMVISDQEIGASLGKDSIIASGKALMIGAIALIILMIFIYRTVGLFAVFAMLLNVLAILAILAMADATLTLSGVGGILLTMGMAVDANVLIYERLREELDAGKPFRGALNAAFGRAFSVILDSNITTLLPALVLLSFEIVQESVRGFWLALAIGLIVNLYTGLTVTRALIETYVSKRKALNRASFIGTWVPFKNASFDFMKMRRGGYVVSGILVVLSAGYLVLHGPNPGIDFTGGVVSTVESRNAEIARADIERAFKQQYHDVKVVRIINTDKFQITVPKTDDEQSLEEIRGTVATILSSSFGDTMTIESTQGIESIVGQEFTISAFFTVLVASLVILGYIALRFRPVFGLGAVIALVHDLLIAFGIFVILGRSLTLDIVSALLIVLGYSVNDTIVVFDRIREKTAELYGHSIGEIINLAINQTLSRTVFTSGTTMLAILSMLIFGGIGLKDFSLILLIGIGLGTYSSIFVASAVVYSFITAKEKKLGVEKAHGRIKTVKIGS